MRQISGTSIKSFIDNEAGHVVMGSIDNASLGAASLPTTTLTFADGAQIVDKSTSLVYVNLGNFITPVWALGGGSFSTDPQMMQMLLVPLSSAAILSTTANTGLSSTNGVNIVPAAPTGFVNVWHRTIVSYTYATAAYTGGGNNTVNIAGGAALSGLIATTTLWQNASSIIQEFVPLSTVAFPITTATAINLKTASAVTQPGTAAGTAKVYTWYSVVAI